MTRYSVFLSNPTAVQRGAAAEYIVERVVEAIHQGYLAVCPDDTLPYWTDQSDEAYRFDSEESAHEAGRYMLESS